MGLRNLFYLILLSLVALGIASAVGNSVKHTASPQPAPVPEVAIAATTGHNDDQEHCFRRDNGRDLTLFVKTAGATSGKVSVELIDLGKLRPLEIPPKPEPGAVLPFMAIGLNSGIINQHKSTVVFHRDSPNHRPDRPSSQVFSHLGVGPYMAVVSVAPAGKGTAASKTAEESIQYLYYYETFINDPGECSINK